jgi:diacylglycerol kinase family enzyme
MTDREVLIVGNPFSGARRNHDVVAALTAALQRRSLRAQVVWDFAQRTALLQDPSLSSWCRCLVVAGGDGTVASVINEPLTVPLAVLPLGNENLLAKELGFTRGPEALADAIAASRTRKLDLGLANTRRFTLMLSAGFDADVVHRVDRWRTRGATLRRVSHRSYLTPIAQSLWQYRHDEIELITPEARVRGRHVLIFNIPRYGGGVQFLPHARPDDGLLDWIVLERPGRWRMLDYLQAIRRGVHLRRADVKHGRASRILLDGHAVPLQVDGDPCGFTPMEVKALPGALCVIDTANV